MSIILKTPSKYQADFFNWVKNGKGSTILKAVAGSGKTTSIINSLLGIPDSQSCVLIAFNKDIATKLENDVKTLREESGRAMPKISAKTFHSLGYSVLRNALKVNVMSPDSKKLYNIARNNLMTGDEFAVYGDFACKLVGLAKGQGIGVLQADTFDSWWNLVQHHDLELEAETADEKEGIEFARRLLQMSNVAAKNDKIIDFDDMLYLPLLWNLRLFQNDWVFIDEAQDTNPVRRALAKLALKPGGRLVAVGDPRQAIYGFTGASHDAIDLIMSEFGCTEMPLTVSFRCAQEIVKEAQSVVPYIEFAETSEAGKVSRDVPAQDAFKLLGNHDAILCRNTAPLFQIAYKLIGEGRGCKILGRDIGTGLVKLINKMRAKTIENLITKLEEFSSREVAKFTAKGQEQKAAALMDKIECINVVINNLNENGRTIPKLIAQLESMFTDGNGVLILSTIHKAKGKEWDVVAIANPELMPSKWARQMWQLTQEQNLRYVAITRAKKHLIYIQSAAGK